MIATPRVGIVFGGPSPEHDVSVLTGLQAARALAAGAPSPPRALYWSKAGEWLEVAPDLEAGAFLEGPPGSGRPLQLVLGPGGGFTAAKGRLVGRPERLEIDVVVNCCHGGPGEDGRLQAALDLAGIAYTGPSAAGAALGMDKLAFAAVVAGAGLPTLERVALLESDEKLAFAGPYIVKPRFGGSSIGIEVVSDLPTALAQLRSSVHLRRGAVVEPYRPDLYDLQLAVRTWPQLELSAIERPLRSAGGGEILGYADKYVGGQGMVSAPRELPAQLGAQVEAELREIATEVARLCEARGVCRIDFLSDGQSLFVNEVNTIPGSLSRHLFVDPPLAFDRLLADLVAEATARPAAQLSTAGADGRVLRSAGSISSKLA